MVCCNTENFISKSKNAYSAHFYIERVDYNPFGKLISSNGSKANDFAFRFSTKYFDNETGLYYYGYRYYNPEFGRWINRDPQEEKTSDNLYNFITNNSITYIDILGLLRDLPGTPRGEFIDNLPPTPQSRKISFSSDETDSGTAKARMAENNIYMALANHCPEKDTPCCKSKQCKEDAKKIAKAYVNAVINARSKVINTWSFIRGGDRGNAFVMYYNRLKNGASIDYWFAEAINAPYFHYGNPFDAYYELIARKYKFYSIAPGYMCYDWMGIVEDALTSFIGRGSGKPASKSKCFKGENTAEGKFPTGHFYYEIFYIGNGDNKKDHILDLDPWPNAMPDAVTRK